MSARWFSLAAMVVSSASFAAPLTVNAGNSPYTAVTGVNDTFDSVTVQSGGTLIINGDLHVTAGDFVVQSGGIVRTTQGVALVNIDAPGRTVDVQFGGQIDLSALGLLGGNRAGNSFGCSGQTLDTLTFAVVTGSGQYSGGSTLVRGGGNSAASFGGQTTASLRGGGGGCGTSNVSGGNGGAALNITAATLRVDGSILNAGGATTGNTAGAGAGGSIVAAVTTFTGAGTLSVRGGNGSGAGGAGGRLYVTLTNNTFTGTISAQGGAGANGWGGGATGVVYIRSAGGTQWVRDGEVTLNGTDSLTSVVMGGGGYLRLSGPAAITNAFSVPTGTTLELNASNALSAANFSSPVDGQLIVTQPATRSGDLTLNGAMLLNSQLNIGGNFTLSAGGTATHSQGDKDAAIVAGGTLSLQGNMNLSGLGCTAGLRWDTVGLSCTGGVQASTGGTHGGLGGSSNIAVYGTQENPSGLGSAGGNSYYDGRGIGGSGGGYVRLQGTTVNIGGSLLADGNNSGGWQAASGAGGGIRIDATTFTGTGTIRANGGSGEGGGGAGGRIAVYYTTNTFSGAILAQGGTSSFGWGAGGQGTVYMRSAAGILTVRGGLTDLGSSDSVTGITFGAAGHLRLSGAAAVTNPISVPAGATIELNSPSAFGGGAQLASPVDGQLIVTLPVTRPGDLVVNGSLSLNAEFTVGNNFTLSPGASASHNQGDRDASLVAGGTLSLQGAFNVSGKGCTAGLKWDGTSQTCIGGVQGSTGGTYGGLGGSSNVPIYGAQENPAGFGSAGGNSYYDGRGIGGNGGGYVKLQGTTVNIGGSVIADGNNSGGWQAASGAGGGIRIDATTFTGTGTIRANGGNGEGGGGAGGRIAVYFTTNTFSGAIQAVGGTSSMGWGSGGQGTTYLRSNTGILTVKGGLTELSGTDSVTGISFGPGGYLRLNGPASITNPIIVPAGATLEVNSGLAFSGGASLTSPIDGQLVVSVPFTRTTDLTINGSLLLNAEMTVNGNFTLSAGGSATHSAQDRDASIVASGTLNVQGAMNFSARGCPAGLKFDTASQTCIGGVQGSTGGSYGGLGGSANVPVYGVQEAPNQLGSGGGNSYYDGRGIGGAGGGLIKLSGATVRVDGTIIADGANSGGWQAASGAGGGIRIDATTFTGTGTLRANGGSGEGGGGAGGRIGVYYTSSTYVGAVSAFGGTSSFGWGSGGMGTVYMRSSTPGAGILTVRGGLTELSGTDTVQGIQFGQQGHLRLNGPANITNPIVVPTAATLELNAGTALTAATLGSPVDGQLTVSVPITRNGDLVVNGALLLNAEFTVGNGGNFTLSAGGTATHDPEDNDASLVATGNLTIAGTMNFSGKGCGAARKWDNTTQTCISGVQGSTGGTYGGLGGSANVGLYGSQENPAALGTGGGNSYYDGRGIGGAGGGLLKLSGNTVTISGVILNDGNNSGGWQAASGAGGGVRIDATTFTGGGSIRAQGGSGEGGGGGGGRIAVYYVTNTFTGVITAFGGTSSFGWGSGGQGTVYMRSTGGALKVNGGLTELSASDNVTSIAFGPAGHLRLNGAATITAPLVVPAGSTLELNSPNALDNATLTSPVAGQLIVSAPITRAGDLSITGSMLLNARYTAGGDFTLATGATASHTQGDSDGQLIAGGKIDVLGTWDVRGRGCPASQKFDMQTKTCVGGVTASTGGTYGGAGGSTNVAVYGDPEIPIELGSGGGNSYYDGRGVGGAGGGLVRLQAPTVNVTGFIYADGNNSGGWQAASGAGGAVKIDTTTFNGNGIIRSNGGSGEGGGGGGGRIAINYTSFNFTGVISAFGGTSSFGWGPGANGTSRAKSTGTNPGLKVIGGDWRVNATQTFNDVTVYGGGVLYLDGAVTVITPMTIPAGGTVWLNTQDATNNIALQDRIDGNLVVNAAMTLTKPRQVGGLLWTRQPVVVPQSMDLLPAGTLRADDLFTLTGDLTMAPGATITHSFNVRKFDLRVSGRLYVPVGAQIHADGVGFPGGYGGAYGCAGTSFDPVAQLVAGGVGQYAGGSFGGAGGGNTNPLYGSSTNVDYPGAGGGCGNNNVWGGHGGGLVKIAASVFELYGHLRANGANTPSNGAGGGAGGGLHVVAAALLGNGLIRANGGNSSGGGGGGGGRILLDIGNNTFTGLVEARGGTGSVAGLAGTISTPSNTAPPTIISVPAAVAKVNAAWSYDSDGLPQAVGAGPYTWSLTVAPPGATVNATTGAFSWTPTSLGRSDFVLRVANVQGFSEQQFSVDVLAPPVVTSSGAGSGALNLPYHYNASDSIYVTGSQPMSFLATVAPSGAPSLAVDQTGRITWTPDTQGSYTPCVRVTNPVGQVDHCWNVTVSGAINPPTITSTPPLTAAIGVAYTYQVLAGGTPPITYSFLPGASPTGASIGASSGTVNFTPTAVGTPYFCVRAQNVAGADTQCWDVAVLAAPESPVFASNCAPLAQVGAPYHYDADDTVNVTGSAPMAFTLLNAPAGMTIDAGGRLSWTPATQQAVVFSIRATNSAGSATQTCVVTARGSDPNAGAPLILRTANPVAAVGLPYFVGPGSKLVADGQKPITWSKVSGPSTLRVDSATGTLSWKPAAAGVQTLSVKATNALGEDTYTFDVDVKSAAPNGPRAGIKGGGNITGAAPFTVNADSSDTTSSAKILSWNWSWGDGSANSEGQTASHTYTGCGGYVLRLTVTDEFGQTSVAEQLVAVTCGGLTPPVARIVMPVRTGSVSLNANFSAEIIPGTGTIHGQQWISTDGFSSDLAADSHTFSVGGHTLQLIVVDSNGLTAIDRVQVMVSDAAGNEPPRIAVWATPPGGAAPIQITYGQSAVDADGAITAAEWSFLDGNTSTESAPSKQYTDATNDRATYTVTDDKGLKSSAMVEVNITSASGDAPPEIISTPRLSVFAGQEYTYDKDGMPTVRGAGPFSYALTTMPEGATVDASTGLLKWTPAATLSGNFDFTLEVTGRAGKAKQSWVVEVVGTGTTTNPPPTGCSCGVTDPSLVWLALAALGGLSRRRRSR